MKDSAITVLIQKWHYLNGPDYRDTRTLPAEV